MRCIDRYEEYKDEDLDVIILKIRNGTIKAGRFSHLVKVNKDKIYSNDQHEFFNRKNGDD